jgi:hypothetical protein
MASATFTGTGDTSSRLSTGATAGTATTSTHPLIESDRVEGTSVYGADNTHIGSIDRLMIEKVSGQVVYAVVSFGGFLGLGEESFTVPWGKLTYDTDLGGYKTDLSPDQLRGAPSLGRDDANWSDRDRERDLHTYYGVSPYWGL